MVAAPQTFLYAMAAMVTTAASMQHRVAVGAEVVAVSVTAARRTVSQTVPPKTQAAALWPASNASTCKL